MRVLVAITCVMVITAISYFFWGEYRDYKERQAATLARAQQIIREETVGRAINLSKSGRCTDLATLLVDNAGSLTPGDKTDARACSFYSLLGAYERNTFDRFKHRLSE